MSGGTKLTDVIFCCLRLHRDVGEPRQRLLRHVGAEHALGRREDVTDVQRHRLRVQLAHERGDDAALARHPLVVRRLRAAAGVPERVVTVEVLSPRLDPTLDGRGTPTDRSAPLDRDVEAADGVDEAAEALEVDEDVVLDVEVGERLDRLGRRDDARVRRARGELVRMVVRPGVQAVEEALVAAGPSLAASAAAIVEPGRKVMCSVSRENPNRTTRPVSASTLASWMRVRPQPLAAGAAVAAEQEDVVATVGRGECLAAR